MLHIIKECWSLKLPVECNGWMNRLMDGELETQPVDR